MGILRDSLLKLARGVPILLSMGNLYTRLIRRKNDSRIEILAKLKMAWNTYPRDYDLIKSLEKQLPKIKPVQPKPEKSPFIHKEGQGYFLKSK